jgi:hypothetical protein
MTVTHSEVAWNERTGPVFHSKIYHCCLRMAGSLI